MSSIYNVTIELCNKIERSVYNKRKRRLFDITNQLRESMANELLQFEDNFIVDSMPLEVCKLSRSNRSKIIYHLLIKVIVQHKNAFLWL